MTKVAVIGTGYVGLTTGACLSHIGHDVTCADIDQEKINRLSLGEIPIVEEGLEALVADGLAEGTLRFVVGGQYAVKDAEIVFMCLPTPQGEDGSADLKYIKQAAAEIGPHLQPGSIVVNKSTVPVGTARIVKTIINRDDIDVVSNPEFLREGSAVGDFLNPDRVVVGSDSLEASRAVGALYSPLHAKIVATDSASAELIKYAANSFLATKLSFINSIATICEYAGADIDDVVAGVGSDRRIGPDFLRPGPGWGGSCFPKDTRALIKISEDLGFRFGLLESAVLANEAQIDRIVAKIHQAADGTLSRKKIAIWGLTFKAGTDDLRDSPAVAIANRVYRIGGDIIAYDPTVSEIRSGIPNGTKIATSELDAAYGADVLVVLTEWPQFKTVDPHAVAQVMRKRTVVDGRNILNRQNWINSGFKYQGIGKA